VHRGGDHSPRRGGDHSARRDGDRAERGNGDRSERRGEKPQDDQRFRKPRRPDQFAGVQRKAPVKAKHGQMQVRTVEEPMRIAKAMARAGLCSRREAERWIADGRVSVNGQVLTTPAFEVGPKARVLVDGQPLPVAEPAQLWRYYKPKGLVTTHSDPQGRPTVFDNLPPGLPRVVSVGRLDFNTEGLILLTNDGELARHLELPATGWLRRYRVRAKGRATQVDFDKLKDGVELDGVNYGPVDATVDTVQGANMWITIGIREGKNREVRKVLASLGLEVNRLIRISFGPFQLLELEPGETEIVRRRVLADQLGPQLAAEFGLVDPDEVRDPKGRGGKTGAKPPRKPREGADEDEA
jgi:23S rRNA pseudouridine2605 synthase